MSARILYVDDEVELLDLARSFFEDESLPLETCSDFHQAVNLVKSARFDVIISDAKMPSGSGHELFHLLRHQLGFKGKLILVTGNLEKPGIQTDYDLVIYKPIKFHDLIDVVKSFLI